MGTIFTTQNRILALTILDELDYLHPQRSGLNEAAPRIRVELTPKIELEPGRYTLNRPATLRHYLPLDAARLLFYDLAQKNLFTDHYHVIFRHDQGFQPNKPVGVANQLAVIYRRYDHTGDERICLEIWDGPGKFDRVLGYVYPLDKEHHALSMTLEPSLARAMALAGLDAIQVWNTTTALRAAGWQPPPGKPQQLSLALA